MLARDDDGGPEMFLSIQGEGPSVGKPRYFIRLSGCNLNCIWCDTAYTWNWEGTDFKHKTAPKYDRDAESECLPLTAIIEQISQIEPPGIVITGGEPLLQQGRLVKLLEMLKSQLRGIYVEIETNGSIKPIPELIGLVDQFNVSPKLNHSGNKAEIAQKPEALSAFSAIPQAFFKFVVAEKSNINAINRIVWSLELASERVWLMPLGTDSETIRQRAEWLVPAAIESGYSFSDRLHIHLFGARRGV